MKDASRVMYTIAKVLNIISIVGIALLFIGAITIAANPGEYLSQFQEALNDAAITEEVVLGIAVGLIVYALIALAVLIVCIVLVGKAQNALEDPSKNAPHIVMIVLAVFSGSLFYLLGGIFGLVANGQNKPAQNE